MRTQDSRRLATLAGYALCVAAFPGSLWASNAYVVRNLASDVPDLADFTDPHLKGAWGISESASSPFWISDAGSGLSTLYSSAGSPISLVVTIPASKAVGAPGTGTPTGTVYHATPGVASATGAAAALD